MSKAKVISVLNHKGGVGKTTTTINLGGALRQKGYKVLLIDLDGQANLTESLGFSAELPQTIYGAMKGEYDLPIYEHKDGLSVVPSCLDLSAVETELINEAGRELILAHLIKGQKEKFDYILIDCPPSLSLLTLNALTASDRLIIPGSGSIPGNAWNGQTYAGRPQGAATFELGSFDSRGSDNPVRRKKEPEQERFGTGTGNIPGQSVQHPYTQRHYAGRSPDTRAGYFSLCPQICRGRGLRKGM